MSLYSSLYFPCAYLWELSYSKIYLMCFFFASRLYFYMVAELQFLHGIRAQGCSSSTELRSYIFSLSERIQSPIPLWRRALFNLTIFSPSFICAGCKEFLLEHINTLVCILLHLWYWIFSTIMNRNPRLEFYCTVRDSIEFLWL